MILRIVFALSTLVLAGCSSQTYSIAELGHPEFEAVVGKETRFERPDPNQRGNLDAFTDDVSKEADHRFLVSFLPAGSEARIGVEVRAHVKGKLPFRSLAAAAYPVDRQEASVFAATGRVPPGRKPLAVEAESEEDDAGWRVLHLIFERQALPEGTEMLAVPTLAQFKDGWISIRFYTTRVPAPLKMLTPEEVQQLKSQSKDGAAAPPSEPTRPGKQP